MKRYTTRMHVKNLKKMLANLYNNSTNLWISCPVGKDWDVDDWSNSPHKVCRKFVGVPERMAPICPCHYFKNSRKAIEITEEKIKKWEEKQA